jgi:hypothetical protein
MTIARALGVEFNRVAIAEPGIPDFHDRRVLPDVMGFGVT